jgi:hypothetical protein
MALIPEEHSQHIAVIQDMVDSAPAQQAAITDQLAQIELKQEEITEQIEVLNGDVIDYATSKLQAILMGLSNWWNRYFRPPGEPFMGEFDNTENYIVDQICSYTDTCAPYTFKHYRCIQTITGGEIPPNNPTNWVEHTLSMVSIPDEHNGFVYNFSGSTKAYGATQRNWSIQRGTAVTTIDPGTGLPVTTVTYTDAYIYQGGIMWPAVDWINDQVIECVEGWENSVDLIKKPIVEPGGFDPMLSASYGLEALYSVLEKAKAYLTNNRDKIMQMFDTLTKFLPKK